MWVDVEKWNVSAWIDDETGKVTRGTKGSGFDYRAVYPYVPGNGGLDNCSGEYTLEQLKKKSVMWA